MMTTEILRYFVIAPLVFFGLFGLYIMIREMYYLITGNHKDLKGTSFFKRLGIFITRLIFTNNLPLTGEPNPPSKRWKLFFWIFMVFWMLSFYVLYRLNNH